MATLDAAAQGMERALSAVRDLLLHVGEDPDRDGLVDTPDRVARAFEEMTAGYREDPSLILARVFDVPYDEMVVVRDIEFWSLCEHHLLPFHGTATVGYLPHGKVVGLSKIPRLVQCYARRLQVQERMTQQIAEAMEEHLDPLGVGVVVRAHHTCMGARGIKCDAHMVTSCLLGAMRDHGVREEFLRLTG